MSSLIRIALVLFMTSLLITTCSAAFRQETQNDIPVSSNTLAGLQNFPNMASYSQSMLKALRESPGSSRASFADLSMECLTHLNAWSENLDTLWSLRMLDATSKINEGILTGHTNSYGDFDECLATWAKINATSTEAETGFKGRYCTAYLVPGKLCQATEGVSESGAVELRLREAQMKAVLAPIFEFGITPGVAVCMPSSCSNSDIQTFFAAAIAATNQTEVCFRVNHCQTDDKPKLRASDISMIALLAFIAALSVFGTAVDLFLSGQQDGGGSSRQPSKAIQSIIAFSLYTNTRKWLNTKGGGDNLGCIHGIRFLSTCWVVLTHTWTLWMERIWNLTDLMRIYEDWTVYPIINGSLSVDTFFTVAGMLMAYTLMKMLDKTKGRLNVPMLYLHRYLRLTPTYAILIGIMATWFEYLKPGPRTYGLINGGSNCRNHWWHNLLYINNLVKYDMSDAGNWMCHGESWYLGNDMQFFIVSPLLLLPLWRWRVPGLILMGLFTVASIVVPVSVTYAEKLDSTIIVTGLDAYEVFYNKSYIKPWMRFGSYVVGLWAGYFLYVIRKRRSPLKLPRWAVALGWAVSTALALTILFSVRPFFDPEKEYLRLGSALYAGMHRFGWGLSVSWVVLACTMGYGGFVNTFLSWKVFIPLGRLSFCVYLISYWLQSLLYLSARQDVSYDLYTGMNHFFSHVVMSLLVSFVACMTLESPFMALEKIIFQQDKPQQHSKPKPADAANNGPTENGISSMKNGDVNDNQITCNDDDGKQAKDKV